MMIMALGSRLAMPMRSRTALLEAFLGIVEEAQVFHLIDAEDESGALDRPHQLAERGDDLEGAILAGVGIEGGDGVVRQRGELSAVEVLANALVDAWVSCAQGRGRARTMLMSSSRVAILGACDDVVGELEHELGEAVLAEARLAELLQDDEATRAPHR